MNMQVLNQKQLRAIELVKQGHNLFLTGAAGTGKTRTLHEIIKYAKENNLSIGVTAMTGSAALLIKGKTVHSFLGIGLGTRDAHALVYYTETRGRKISKMLKKLDILIIDEISMMESGLLRKISSYMSLLRKSDLSFGGVQVVLSGDFCQLPPVNGEYCFLSDEWDRMQLKAVILTQIYRQGKDLAFQELLGRLRKGHCTETDLTMLEKCKHTEFANGVLPTRLYALHKDVDRINDAEFQKLIDIHGIENIVTYKRDVRVNGHAKVDAAVKWANASNIPEQLKLCKDAQVVVTWNISQETDIVNGTRGVVECVDTQGANIRIQDGHLVRINMHEVGPEDDPSIKVKYLPLKLAYAITHHKSQGMSLDCLEVDLGSSIFEYGQAYTALSRAKSLEHVRIVNIDRDSFRTHPDVTCFYGF